jgi:Ulp1 family protease
MVNYFARYWQKFYSTKSPSNAGLKWRVIESEAPQQKNGVDCGIYACIFMSFILNSINRRECPIKFMAKIEKYYGNDFSKSLRRLLAGALATPNGYLTVVADQLKIATYPSL